METFEFGVSLFHLASFGVWLQSFVGAAGSVENAWMHGKCR
jgi:hypothetical protein